MNKFEELLAKYGKTAEEVTFEIEGLSDEELEAKFVEAFEDAAGEGDNGDGEGDDTDGDNSGDVDGDGESADNGNDGDGEGTGDDGSSEGEGEGTFESRKSYSIDDNGNATITFEISHEDIRGALFNLISIYEDEDNEWYWISNVYDDYFIFENWMGDKLYKQSYEVDGDNVSLSGDRQEMFKMILTESEKLAIEKMREDYSALEGKYNELKEFKDNYDAAELKVKKDAVLAKEAYAVLADNEAFKTLIADAEKYSVEEVDAKAKAIFADHVIETGEFSAQTETQKPNTLSFNLKEKETKKKKAYGGLFD